MAEQLNTNENDRLVEKRRHVTEYLDNTRQEREWGEVHRDYYDDKQWTAAEIATLNDRGQPVITDNKIKDKVEYMEGVERKTRTDPKAFPRTPVEDQNADIATDSIRYVFDANRFQVTKSTVFQNLCIEGAGGVEVVPDKKDPRRILIRKIRWDRLYRDPYSMEADYSDAGYLGIITWMDENRALWKVKSEEWTARGAKEAIESTSAHAQAQNAGESSDDKPYWADTKRKRICIFEEYEKRDGTVYRSVFCWGGFLEEEEECPYIDPDTGEHEWPIIAASAYIDREGQRYGLVKRYMSLQDLINKFLSKALHLLNSKRIIADQGAVENVAKARKEVHKPDGYVETVPGSRFDVEDNIELSVGFVNLFNQAQAALGNTGPNAALLGQSGSISGRAKQLDQQGGALQIGVLFDNIRDWQQRVATAVWHRIRQYWDDEMMIRVTDNEAGLKFITINRQLTQGDLIAKRLKNDPMAAQKIAALAQEPTAQLPAFNEDGTPVRENDIAQLDVDIIIDEAPDVVTLQAEEFENLVNLVRSGQIQMPPDVLIEASNLRSDTKRRIRDALKGENDPMAQMQAQFAQMMSQLEAMLKQAEIRETNASADLKQAQARSEEVGSIAKVVETTDPPPPPTTPGIQGQKAA